MERDAFPPVSGHMPRYFFHLHNDIDADDEEGTELANAEAARSYAIESIRAVAVESVREGHLNLEHNIEITDEAGRNVVKVRFGEAIHVTGQADGVSG